LVPSNELTPKDLIIVSMPFDARPDAQNNDRYEPAQETEATEIPEQALIDATPPLADDTPSEKLYDTPLENPHNTPVETPIDPLISTLPPEALGETNGGPLGCCLGTVAGLFLTLALILLISISIGNGGYLGWATAPIALLGAVSGGYAGWRIGKLIYREYELSPQRRERLERTDQQWRAQQRRAQRVRHPKIG
jgi:hypothetical protein